MSEAMAAQSGVYTGTLDAAYRKVTWRLLPFLFLCYFAAYLDRVNVGFAQLQMQQELGFSAAVYGLGAGMFFIGYFFFEVPSNIVMAKIGAKLTLMRIMIAWGLISSATMFVTEAWMFYVLRFLLGAFEAGFAPGVILYFTYWYPSRLRARILALFLTAVAISGLIGGPVSGAILSGMHGYHGLSGWQWMFVLEGLPSVVLGIAVYFVLSNRPREAKWLSDDEKQAIEEDLARDAAVNPTSHAKFGAALKDPRLYALAFVYFSITAGVYLISFWLPQIVRDLGAFSPVQIGFITAIPYGVAAAFMVWLGLRSDRTGERRWHCAVSGIIGSLALLATVWSPNVTLSIALFSVATAGIFAMMPVFWAIPPRFFSGVAAAGTIAAINSIGTLSGFVSPSIVGSLKTWTGSLTPGLLVITGVLWAGVIVLIATVPASQEKRS